MSEPLTVVDLSDTTAPTLTSIEDDQSGGPVAVPQAVVYTVTFDEPMSAGSVNVSDFENASATVVMIDSVGPTADPAVYEVTVTTTEAGTLQLQIKQDTELADVPGNLLNTTFALPDDTIIEVTQDLITPTLISITDNVAGGPIVAKQSMTPVYTVTFSEAIDPVTLEADDFENGSSAPVTIDSVGRTGDPAAFEVVLTTSGPGDLVLQIGQDAEIKDLAGNSLDTSSPLPDDTTITVNPASGLEAELGVLDLVNANGGINPATGAAWAEGDQYRLAFVTSTGTPFTSSDINFYNTFVQGVAATAGYGSVDWKIIGSTESVDARDNTGTNPSTVGVPIFLMDGTTKIADNNADLWDGSLDNALGLDENGAAATGNAGRVLTGSLPDGTESDGTQYLGNPTQVRSGSLTATNGLWMRVFTENPNGGLSSQAVYAMSGLLTVVSGTTGPQITSITSVGVDLWELTLKGAADTGYEFRSSPILDFDPGTLVENLTAGGDPVGTIGGTSNSVLTTDSNGDGTARMILSGNPADFVRAQIPPPPPPLFSADFEADNGGFTATGTPNDWAWGTPNSNNNAGLVLTTGNGDSTNCWATNPGDGSGPPSGVINTAANSILRSPDIDLTGITGAELAFAAAVDTQTSDTVEILVKEVGTDNLLDTISPVVSPLTANWDTFGPFGLSAADNTNVYLEFRFVGTGAAYIGLYIDDVTVTATN